MCPKDFMVEQKEVEKSLKALSQKAKPQHWLPFDYVGAGQSKYIYLNLTVPSVRLLMKKGYSFSDRPVDEQWAIWHHIWLNTKYFEAAASALYFVNARPVEELFIYRKNLLTWINRIDNWAHSDDLSNAYAKLLEYNQSKTLKYFAAWSRSPNPWKKRQSMVGLLFYSRFRKKVLSFKNILKFIKPHLSDEHYYVQKAVGWTLRECWNLYPKETYSFLLKNADKIPSGGWTAATEKLAKSDKARLTKLRKKIKKSN